MFNKAAIMLLTMLSFCLAAKAQEDSIGFWKIQNNNKEIGPVCINGVQTYLISSPDDTGKLDIFYFTGSPCKKCLCKLELRDENGNPLKTFERKGYGDNSPFEIMGKELSPMLAKGRVYMYFSGKYDGWMPWVPMGALKAK